MGSIIDKKSVSGFIMGFTIMFTIASILLMTPEQMWRWLLSSESVEKKVERALTSPSTLLQELETEKAALQDELIQLRKGIDARENTIRKENDQLKEENIGLEQEIKNLSLLIQTKTDTIGLLEQKLSEEKEKVAQMGAGAGYSDLPIEKYENRVIESNEFVFVFDSFIMTILPRVIGCDILITNKKPERELTIRNLDQTRLIDNNGNQAVLKVALFGYTVYTPAKSTYDDVSASLIQSVPTKVSFWFEKLENVQVTKVSLKLYCSVGNTDFSVTFRNIPVGGKNLPDEMSD